MSDDSETPVTVVEAGKLFPSPLSERAVLRRIKSGIEGVKLAADFDGYRYWVHPSAVARFLDQTSAKRKARTERLSRLELTLKERAAAALDRIRRM